jgi:hypothetical protein
VVVLDRLGDLVAVLRGAAVLGFELRLHVALVGLGNVEAQVQQGVAVEYGHRALTRIFVVGRFQEAVDIRKGVRGGRQSRLCHDRSFRKFILSYNYI